MGTTTDQQPLLRLNNIPCPECKGAVYLTPSKVYGRTHSCRTCKSKEQFERYHNPNKTKFKKGDKWQYLFNDNPPRTTIGRLQSGVSEWRNTIFDYNEQVRERPEE